jgi:tetratricopeptide (TPR) repeat protein
VGVLIGAGCGGQAASRKSSGASTLADRLDEMSAAAQIDTLRSLTRQDPDDATLAFYAGNAYYAMGVELPAKEVDQALAYYDSAATAFRHATQIDTTYSRAFVNMGLALDSGRKGNEARAAFKRAIAIDPNDVLAYCHLGFLEYTAGHRTEAMRLYQQALVIDPDSAQAHYNLGLAFAEARIFREALGEWQRAAAADPDGALGRMAAENATIIQTYLADSP